MSMGFLQQPSTQDSYSPVSNMQILYEHDSKEAEKNQSAYKNLQLYGDSPLTFEEFYNKQGYGSGNPNDLGHSIGNWFHGSVTSAKQAYENYLSEYEYRRNQSAVAAANKETYAREDTQIQRLLADYQKAGLNPYMLLAGGNLSSGVVSSQAQRPDYKRSSKQSQERSKNGSILGTALKLLAILALKG